MDLRNIAKSILNQLKNEKKYFVKYPSIGRAVISWNDGMDTYWMVRTIPMASIYTRDFHGNIIGTEMGTPQILDIDNIVSRDSKLGEHLLKRIVGDTVYSAPMGKTRVYIHSLSLFNPIFYPIVNAVDGFIKNVEIDYQFKSIIDELAEWEKLLILELESQNEPDSEEKEKLINEIRKFKEELIASKEKKRRHIITGAELRDRPYLDPTQDTLKRSKVLDGSLILIGGPGTGKTTSLVQRITFLTSDTIKEYKPELRPDELNLILDRSKSWLFISPTELLRLYLRNIMTRESLNADDDRVVVWESYRRILFRRLSLINPETQRPFQIIGSNDHYFDLTGIKLKNIIFEFEKFFIENQIKRIKEINNIDINNLEWSALGKDIVNSLSRISELDSIWKFINLFDQIRSKYNDISKKVLSNYETALLDTTADCHLKIDKDKVIKEKLEKLLRENKLKTNPVADSDIDEEDEEESIHIPVFNFRNELNRVLRNVIRKEFLKRIDNKTKLSTLEEEVYRIVKPLINENKFIIISEGALFNKHFYRLLRGFEYNVMREIPQLYKNFRKEKFTTLDILTRDGRELFENSIKNNSKKVHIEEMDMILLIIFHIIYEIYDHSKRLYNNSEHIYLNEYRELTKTVIAVDEASDFNILELACMSFLAHPRFKAVTLSGDLMQRLETNGIENWDEYTSFFKNSEIAELSISYRQTSKLLDIAKKIYLHNTNQELNIEPAYEASEDDPNPLVYIGNNFEMKIHWIAERIYEIHSLYDNKLPSIAIFLGNDDVLNKFAKALNETDKLIDNDIKSVACPNGEILGDPQNVRLFNIKYIKGMEFEAVIYVDIDTIEDDKSKLLDRFLYVGVSRASFFLAVTLNKSFPEQLKYLEDSFTEGKWL